MDAVSRSWYAVHCAYAWLVYVTERVLASLASLVMVHHDLRAHMYAALGNRCLPTMYNTKLKADCLMPLTLDTPDVPAFWWCGRWPERQPAVDSLLSLFQYRFHSSS